MPTKYRVTHSCDLLDKPDGQPIDGFDLTINQQVFGTGKVEGKFIQLDLGDPPGWVHEDNVAPANPADRRPADRAFFVVECVTTELEFNAVPARNANNAGDTTNANANTNISIAPWFASADYLIARANLETGVTNAGPKITNSDAVGPLQVSSAEWKSFLENGKNLAAGEDPNGFDHWLSQTRGAAWRMHFDAKKMNELRIAQGKATEQEPFIPSYLDLWFAYLTNSPAAALAIRDAETPPHLVLIDQVLRAPFGPFTAAQVDQLRKPNGSFSQAELDSMLGPGGLLTDAEIKALLTAREAYFGTANNPRLIRDTAHPDKDVVSNAEAVLNKAFKDAFDDIKKFMPEAITVVSGAAPWLAPAKKAEADGVAEANPAHRDTILDYFNATDHPRPNSVTTPWCGAFAAHCMKASGNPTVAASVPTGAAAAANWKGWGSKLSAEGGTIPEGAVVVLSPTDKTVSTGHVGFFIKFSDNGKRVFLLGGNQSNKVCTTDFDRNRIVYVGWLDLGPAKNAAGFNLPGDIAEDNRKHAKMIVEKFAAAGFGRFQQIAALANAIAESRLNPKAHNTSGEDSVGLFQLYRGRGVGGTHSVAELMVPEFNTDLILAVAKKYAAFAKADTLEKAVDVFVRRVERPRDQDGESTRRAQIARSLLA
jgi:uncharacterized protein (TIGR02594 family)